MTAYAVARRTRQIGIRIALGARPGQVQTLLISDALRLGGVGLVTGLVLARGSGQAVRSILFGVGAGDPLTFAAVIGLLVAVTLVSAWMPVRRAKRLDPIVALREP